ncbi:gene transfer agent family protein [Kordiimonas aquimaris]|uniref:gene transfer agent family protein n=1 Tax=Kordiimonas aquimaris TaxID=707591 RepID=UPI0021D02ED8|nr:gene transfer agent family protein [Kordiimonas aquimaris]
MAKTISGETSLMVGRRKRRLRLDIGTMMDLEDHFGMGLVPFLTERFPQFRLKDLAVLFLAMTGGDFGDEAAVKRAGASVVKGGIADAATAISKCLEATLSPSSADEQKRHVPGKP